MNTYINDGILFYKQENCINCGEASLYSHNQCKCKRSHKFEDCMYNIIHYKCDKCGCLFGFNENSQQIDSWYLQVNQDNENYIEISSYADGKDEVYGGPYSGVRYFDLDEKATFKLLANKFLMPAELREKEKLLRCFQ